MDFSVITEVQSELVSEDQYFVVINGKRFMNTCSLQRPLPVKCEIVRPYKKKDFFKLVHVKCFPFILHNQSFIVHDNTAHALRPC